MTPITFASRRLLLRGDAIFLIAMGGFGLFADFASFASGRGPFGPVFYQNPQVIGVVEAHGLALLTGVAAWVCSNTPRRYVHWHLALTHALLGAANIAFFDVFLDIGAATGGIGVTAAHFLFVILQAAAAIRFGSPGNHFASNGGLS